MLSAVVARQLPGKRERGRAAFQGFAPTCAPAHLRGSPLDFCHTQRPHSNDTMSQSTPIRRPSYTPSLSGTPGSPALEQPSPSFSRRVSTASSSTAATQYAHANPSPADRKKRSRLRDYYGLAKGAAPKSGQSLDIGPYSPLSPAPFKRRLTLSYRLAGCVRRRRLLQLARLDRFVARPLAPRE